MKFHITSSSGSRDSIFSLNQTEEHLFSKHALNHCSWLMTLKDNPFKGLAYFSQTTLSTFDKKIQVLNWPACNVRSNDNIAL